MYTLHTYTLPEPRHGSTAHAVHEACDGDGEMESRPPTHGPPGWLQPAWLIRLCVQKLSCSRVLQLQCQFLEHAQTVAEPLQAVWCAYESLARSTLGPQHLTTAHCIRPGLWDGTAPCHSLSNAKHSPTARSACAQEYMHSHRDESR
jgi:hypothetical protein